VAKAAGKIPPKKPQSTLAGLAQSFYDNLSMSFRPAPSATVPGPAPAMKLTEPADVASRRLARRYLQMDPRHLSVLENSPTVKQKFLSGRTIKRQKNT
jgi:hypothetical protein